LPLDNETVDLKGPEYIKTLLSEKLAKRGYHLVEPWRVDEALKSFGVTDAGQIKHINLQELGKKLEVDGIFYGTLKDFSFKHLIVVGLKRVEVEIQFINAQTGKAVWSAQAEASSSGASLAPLEKAMNSTPLSNEAKDVIAKLMYKLPKE